VRWREEEAGRSEMEGGGRGRVIWKEEEAGAELDGESRRGRS